MKERIIESIVAFIFGLVITVVSAVTNADVAIIVLGAILTAIGIGCFIWALVDKDKVQKATAALKTDFDTRVQDLEIKLTEAGNTIIDLELKNTKLIKALEEAENQVAQSKEEIRTKETEIKTLKTEKKAAVTKSQTKKPTNKKA